MYKNKFLKGEGSDYENDDLEVIPDVYPIKNLKFDSNRNLIIECKDKVIVYDLYNRKIAFQSNEKPKKIQFDRYAYGFQFEDKSVLVLSHVYEKFNKNKKVDEYSYKTTVSEFKGSLEFGSIVRDCVLCKNEEGKVAICNVDGTQYTDFIYENCDDASLRGGCMKIKQDDKYGLYSTVEKKFVVEPSFKDIEVSKMAVVFPKGEYYHDSLTRYLFADENGKYGIVNSKGHIVIDPVLQKRLDEKYPFKREYNDIYNDSYRIFNAVDEKGGYGVTLSLSNPKLFPSTPGVETLQNGSEYQTEVPECLTKYYHDDKEDLPKDRFTEAETQTALEEEKLRKERVKEIEDLAEMWY